MSRMQTVFDAAVKRFQEGMDTPGNAYNCVLGTLQRTNVISQEDRNKSNEDNQQPIHKMLKQLECIYEGWTLFLVALGITVDDSDKMVGGYKIATWNRQQQVEWYNRYLERIAAYHGLEFNLPKQPVVSESNLVKEMVMEAV